MSYAITVRNEEESRVLLGHDRGECPFVAIMNDDGSTKKICSIYEDIEKIYDIPVMEFREIQIVCCDGEEDVAALFGATTPWNPLSFMDPKDFRWQDKFIVSGSKLCRFYYNLSDAQKSFPWAHVVEASSFGESFNKISLSEVLKL